jgi:hypothetical protein
VNGVYAGAGGRAEIDGPSGDREILRRRLIHGRRVEPHPRVRGCGRNRHAYHLHVVERARDRAFCEDGEVVGAGRRDRSDQREAAVGEPSPRAMP